VGTEAQNVLDSVNSVVNPDPDGFPWIRMGILGSGWSPWIRMGSLDPDGCPDPDGGPDPDEVPGSGSGFAIRTQEGKNDPQK
jgi:hypothetical protein